MHPRVVQIKVAETTKEVRMSSTRTGFASLALVAVALAAGCGGGGHNAATLTKAEVIQRGTVICKVAERRAEKLPEPTVEHPFAKTEPSAVQKRARRWLAGMAGALDDSRVGLMKLAAPTQDKQLLDGYLRDIGIVVTELRAASKAPAARVEPEAQKAFALFERASKQTAAYDFPKGVCGAGDS
jgi:hypothetical protein